MSNFDNNPRRKQELEMRPAIDAIYNTVWPGCSIKRYEHEADFVLDIKHAIDVEITQPNGMILLGQEKALSAEYSKYGTVTVEYMQDPTTEEHGDWFHLASQFYFCGYATEDKTGFSQWVVLNWPSVVLESQNGHMPWEGPRDNSKTQARANFRHIKMALIPSACILAHGGFTPKEARATPELVLTPMQIIQAQLPSITQQEVKLLLADLLLLGLANSIAKSAA